MLGQTCQLQYSAAADEIKLHWQLQLIYYIDADKKMLISKRQFQRRQTYVYTLRRLEDTSGL